jgi:hypothetical protein
LLPAPWGVSMLFAIFSGGFGGVISADLQFETIPYVASYVLVPARDALYTSRTRACLESSRCRGRTRAGLGYRCSNLDATHLYQSSVFCKWHGLHSGRSNGLRYLRGSRLRGAPRRMGTLGPVSVPQLGCHHVHPFRGCGRSAIDGYGPLGDRRSHPDRLATLRSGDPDLVRRCGSGPSLVGNREG